MSEMISKVDVEQGATAIAITEDGQQYILQNPDGSPVSPQDLIVLRDGNDLVITYADGTKVVLEGFFLVDAEVALQGQDGDAQVIASDSEGVALEGGGELIWAQGEQASLMEMAQGNDALVQALEAADFSDGGINWGGWLLGAAAIGGGIAAAAGGGGSSSSAPAVEAPLDFAATPGDDPAEADTDTFYLEVDDESFSAEIDGAGGDKEFYIDAQNAEDVELVGQLSDGVDSVVFTIDDIDGDARTLTINTDNLDSVDGAHRLVFDFSGVDGDSDNDVVVLDPASTLGAFSEIEVVAGTVSILGVNLPAGTTFTINSGLELSVAHFLAVPSITSVTGDGEVTIIVASADDAAKLMTFVADLENSNQILIGTSYTIKVAEGVELDESWDVAELQAALDAVTYPSIPELTTMVEVLDARVDDLSISDISDLSTELSDLNAAISNLEGKTATAINDFASDLAAAQTTLQAAIDTVSGNLETEVNALQTALEGNEADIAALIDDAADNGGTATTASIAGLTAALTALQELAGELSDTFGDRLDDVEGQLADITGTVKDYIDGEIATLQTALEGNDADIAALIDDSADNAGTATTASIAGLQAAIASLQSGTGADVRNLVAEVGAPASGTEGVDYVAATGLYLAIETAVAAAVTDLEGQIDDLQTAIDGLEVADISGLSSELTSLGDSISELQTLAVYLSETFDARLDAIEDILDGLTDTVVTYVQSEISALEGTLEGSDYTTIKALSDAIQALEGAGLGDPDDSNSIAGQLKSLSDRLDALEAQPDPWTADTSEWTASAIFTDAVYDTDADVWVTPPSLKADALSDYFATLQNPHSLEYIDPDDNDLDLTSSDWDDAGGDMYDGGNELYIDDDLQSIWSTDNNPEMTEMDWGSYAFLTFPNATVLTITEFDAASFKIDGNTGADGHGSRIAGELEGYEGLSVFYDQIYDAYDPSINKLLITDASNPVLQPMDDNTDNDYFEVTGLEDATFVTYVLIAGDEDVDNGYLYTEDELRSFVDQFGTLEQIVNDGYAVTPAPLWTDVELPAGVDAADVFVGRLFEVNAGGISTGSSSKIYLDDFAADGTYTPAEGFVLLTDGVMAQLEVVDGVDYWASDVDLSAYAGTITLEGMKLVDWEQDGDYNLITDAGLRLWLKGDDYSSSEVDTYAELWTLMDAPQAVITDLGTVTAADFGTEFQTLIDGYDPATITLKIDGGLTVAQAVALIEAGFDLDTNVSYSIEDAYTTIQAALTDPDRADAINNATEVIADGNELANTMDFMAFDTDNLTIEAGAGDDVINASPGNDTIIGEAGADTINLTYNDGSADSVVYQTVSDGQHLPVTSVSFSTDSTDYREGAVLTVTINGNEISHTVTADESGDIEAALSGLATEINAALVPQDVSSAVIGVLYGLGGTETQVTMADLAADGTYTVPDSSQFLSLTDVYKDNLNFNVDSNFLLPGETFALTSESYYATANDGLIAIDSGVYQIDLVVHNNTDPTATMADQIVNADVLLASVAVNGEALTLTGLDGTTLTVEAGSASDVDIEAIEHPGVATQYSVEFSDNSADWPTATNDDNTTEFDRELSVTLDLTPDDASDASVTVSADVIYNTDGSVDMTGSVAALVTAINDDTTVNGSITAAVNSSDSYVIDITADAVPATAEDVPTFSVESAQIDQNGAQQEVTVSFSDADADYYAGGTLSVTINDVEISVDMVDGDAVASVKALQQAIEDAKAEVVEPGSPQVVEMDLWDNAQLTDALNVSYPGAIRYSVSFTLDGQYLEYAEYYNAADKPTTLGALIDLLNEDTGDKLTWSLDTTENVLRVEVADSVVFTGLSSADLIYTNEYNDGLVGSGYVTSTPAVPADLTLVNPELAALESADQATETVNIDVKTTTFDFELDLSSDTTLSTHLGSTRYIVSIAVDNIDFSARVSGSGVSSGDDTGEATDISSLVAELNTAFTDVATFSFDDDNNSIVMTSSAESVVSGDTGDSSIRLYLDDWTANPGTYDGSWDSVSGDTTTTQVAVTQVIPSLTLTASSEADSPLTVTSTLDYAGVLQTATIDLDDATSYTSYVDDTADDHGDFADVYYDGGKVYATITPVDADGNADTENAVTVSADMVEGINAKYVLYTAAVLDTSMSLSGDTFTMTVSGTEHSFTDYETYLSSITSSTATDTLGDFLNWIASLDNISDAYLELNAAGTASNIVILAETGILATALHVSFIALWADSNLGLYAGSERIPPVSAADATSAALAEAINTAITNGTDDIDDLISSASVGDDGTITLTAANPGVETFNVSATLDYAGVQQIATIALNDATQYDTYTDGYDPSDDSRPADVYFEDGKVYATITGAGVDGILGNEDDVDVTVSADMVDDLTITWTPDEGRIPFTSGDMLDDRTFIKLTVDSGETYLYAGDSQNINLPAGVTATDPQLTTIDALLADMESQTFIESAEIVDGNVVVTLASGVSSVQVDYDQLIWVNGSTVGDTGAAVVVTPAVATSQALVDAINDHIDGTVATDLDFLESATYDSTSGEITLTAAEAGEESFEVTDVALDYEGVKQLATVTLDSDSTYATTFTDGTTVDDSATARGAEVYYDGGKVYVTITPQVDDGNGGLTDGTPVTISADMAEGSGPSVIYTADADGIALTDQPRSWPVYFTFTTDAGEYVEYWWDTGTYHDNMRDPDEIPTIGALVDILNASEYVESAQIVDGALVVVAAANVSDMGSHLGSSWDGSGNYPDSATEENIAAVSAAAATTEALATAINAETVEGGSLYGLVESAAVADGTITLTAAVAGEQTFSVSAVTLDYQGTQQIATADFSTSDDDYYEGGTLSMTIDTTPGVDGGEITLTADMVAGDAAASIQALADMTSTSGVIKLEAPGLSDIDYSWQQVTAVGTEGAYVVTWIGVDAISSDSSIYVQKFNADGTVVNDVNSDASVADGTITLTAPTADETVAFTISEAEIDIEPEYQQASATFSTTDADYIDGGSIGLTINDKDIEVAMFDGDAATTLGNLETAIEAAINAQLGDETDNAEQPLTDVDPTVDLDSGTFTFTAASQVDGYDEINITNVFTSVSAVTQVTEVDLSGIDFEDPRISSDGELPQVSIDVAGETITTSVGDDDADTIRELAQAIIDARDGVFATDATESSVGETAAEVRIALPDGVDGDSVIVNDNSSFFSTINVVITFTNASIDTDFSTGDTTPFALTNEASISMTVSEMVTELNADLQRFFPDSGTITLDAESNEIVITSADTGTNAAVEVSNFSVTEFYNNDVLVDGGISVTDQTAVSGTAGDGSIMINMPTAIYGEDGLTTLSDGRRVSWDLGLGFTNDQGATTSVDLSGDFSSSFVSLYINGQIETSFGTASYINASDISVYLNQTLTAYEEDNSIELGTISYTDNAIKIIPSTEYTVTLECDASGMPPLQVFMLSRAVDGGNDFEALFDDGTTFSTDAYPVSLTTSTPAAAEAEISLGSSTADGSADFVKDGTDVVVDVDFSTDGGTTSTNFTTTYTVSGDTTLAALATALDGELSTFEATLDGGNGIDLGSISYDDTNDQFVISSTATGTDAVVTVNEFTVPSVYDADAFTEVTDTENQTVTLAETGSDDGDNALILSAADDLTAEDALDSATISATITVDGADVTIDFTPELAETGVGTGSTVGDFISYLDGLTEINASLVDGEIVITPATAAATIAGELSFAVQGDDYVAQTISAAAVSEVTGVDGVNASETFTAAQVTLAEFANVRGDALLAAGTYTLEVTVDAAASPTTVSFTADGTSATLADFVAEIAADEPAVSAELTDAGIVITTVDTGATATLSVGALALDVVGPLTAVSSALGTVDYDATAESITLTADQGGEDPLDVSTVSYEVEDTATSVAQEVSILFYGDNAVDAMIEGSEVRVTIAGQTITYVVTAADAAANDTSAAIAEHLLAELKSQLPDLVADTSYVSNPYTDVHQINLVAAISGSDVLGNINAGDFDIQVFTNTGTVSSPILVEVPAAAVNEEVVGVLNFTTTDGGTINDETGEGTVAVTGRDAGVVAYDDTDYTLTVNETDVTPDDTSDFDDLLDIDDQENEGVAPGGTDDADITNPDDDDDYLGDSALTGTAGIVQDVTNPEEEDDFYGDAASIVADGDDGATQTYTNPDEGYVAVSSDPVIGGTADAVNGDADLYGDDPLSGADDEGVDQTVTNPDDDSTLEGEEDGYYADDGLYDDTDNLVDGTIIDKIDQTSTAGAVEGELADTDTTSGDFDVTEEAEGIEVYDWDEATTTSLFGGSDEADIISNFQVGVDTISIEGELWDAVDSYDSTDGNYLDLSTDGFGIISASDSANASDSVTVADLANADAIAGLFNDVFTQVDATDNDELNATILAVTAADDSSQTAIWVHEQSSANDATVDSSELSLLALVDTIGGEFSATDFDGVVMHGVV